VKTATILMFVLNSPVDSTWPDGGQDEFIGRLVQDWPVGQWGSGEEEGERGLLWRGKHLQQWRTRLRQIRHTTTQSESRWVDAIKPHCL